MFCNIFGIENKLKPTVLINGVLANNSFAFNKVATENCAVL
jgi:hypothetical protein